jgi:hypothetical protein
LKQYLLGKPTKWGIKAWGIAESSNGCLLKCDIYKGKKRNTGQGLITRGTSSFASDRAVLGKMAPHIF